VRARGRLIMGGNDRFRRSGPPPNVPMNSDQVWMFDAVRALNGRDRGTLVVWWLFGLMFLAVGVVGSNAVVSGLRSSSRPRRGGR
jgi:hypothetical protein